jgi:ACS family D-galactonate transporter-like MFS transporter
VLQWLGVKAGPQRAREPVAAGRWFVLALLVVSIFINYIDRSNLSVSVTNLEAELHIDSEQMGLLLSAFFWSYAALQLLAGWLVDRYNVYLVYGAGFFLWSIATAATGFAGSFGVLFGLRLVLGSGEAVAYPAYSRIIAEDFPERHRGLANALIDAGSKAGPALGTLVGGLIVWRFGWRALFFLLGFGALAWLAPWLLLAPRDSVASRPASAKAGGSGPGFLAIARQRDAWGTFLALFCSNYAWYFIITWLPGYLEKDRHFPKQMMAIYGSVPLWGIVVVAIAAGWASDRLIERGVDRTRVRKGFAVAGLLLATLILPAAMLPDPRLAMALLIVGCASFGMYTANVWAITQTLAGPAAGKWTGMQNCIGNLAGILAPWLTGMIRQRTGSFLYAFAVAVFWLAVGAGSYLFIVRRVEPVRWETDGA